MRKNILVAVVSLVVAFAVLILADRLIGALKEPGLIFEPHSVAQYHTSEFDFTASINSLGLRDVEPTIGKSFKILCLGDSFTFGWGVYIQDSWPKKLEAYLHSNGFSKIEVVNCGQPGTCPTQYKETLARAVPVLKPDLVLIGVLQADDLAEEYQDFLIPRQYGERKWTMKLFGNIIKLFHYEKGIREVWQSQAQSITKSYNRLESIHYSTLDVEIRKRFESGNLNPALVNYYVDFPNRYEVFNDPTETATQIAVQKVTQDFQEMRKTFPRIVFVNLPVIYYADSHNVDSLYARIAQENSLPYIQVHLPKADYFVYDVHPNARGYEEIAEQIGGELVKKGILENGH